MIETTAEKSDHEAAAINEKTAYSLPEEPWWQSSEAPVWMRRAAGCALWLVCGCVLLSVVRAALCASFIVFWKLPWTGRILRTNVMAAAVLLVVVGQFATSKWWTGVQPPIHAAAVDVHRFARTHPGTCAMGARSGMVAYLIDYPLVQTEGLVMDRAYLERVRRREPLLSALASYRVRYYVGTAWRPFTGCFHPVEPFQAGKTSAHIEGDLCAEPVAIFQHEIFRKMIFDLEKERAGSLR